MSTRGERPVVRSERLDDRPVTPPPRRRWSYIRRGRAGDGRRGPGRGAVEVLRARQHLVRRHPHAPARRGQRAAGAVRHRQVRVPQDPDRADQAREGRIIIDDVDLVRCKPTTTTTPRPSSQRRRAPHSRRGACAVPNRSARTRRQANRTASSTRSWFRSRGAPPSPRSPTPPSPSRTSTGLLIAVDVQGTRAQAGAGAQQLAAAGRLTVTAQRVDGTWKIAAVDPR